MTKATNLAVVTGASRGIGREIAATLARHGWDIAFSHLGDAAEVAETTALIEATGRKALGRRCDVGLKDEVWAFYAEVLKTFGRAPDLLVNNAGVQTWASLLELAESDWDRVIRTNLKGTFLNTQRAAQLMVEHQIRGSIVNLGSACNKVAFPRLVDYTASKGGIEQFTKVSATELGPHGIRVNCVAPGAIEHERTKLEAPDYAATWAAITPLGRVGTTTDVAKVVHYLATDAADFVTGQTIYVDGAAFTMPNWPYPGGKKG
ncbi:MAG TPA: SDR family NAD(P)-dependent oxidoreductase [Lacunisphaera sp.]|nr:SDR family NAD(P)-dependent oxidoreductase [Lacunisphaera sp.]